MRFRNQKLETLPSKRARILAQRNYKHYAFKICISTNSNIGLERRKSGMIFMPPQSFLEKINKLFTLSSRCFGELPKS